MSRRDLPDSRCWEKDQWSQEGERGPNGGMGIWQPDMPSVEDGVHSALLAKERVKLIDGLKHHVTMGIPELHLEYAFMDRETEDRASPVLVGKFSKDRWLITHPVPCKGTQHRWIIGKLVNDVIMSGVQTLVVKSDQEASIVDVKNALMRELRGVEGLTVMPEESPVGASAVNAVIVRSVREMQSTTRALVAYAEWVHGTVFEPRQCYFDVGCGVLRTGGQQVPKKCFGWEDSV